jgi:hypothetical protein
LINEEGLWQDILKKKYLKGKALAQIERKTGGSYFCKNTDLTRFFADTFGR